jgi:hypothetical protein
VKLLAILVAISFSCASLAQEIVPLDKGTPAPFDGVLLDKDAAAEIISREEITQEQCDAKSEFEVDKATNACTLKKDIAETSLKIERETNGDLLLLKSQEIERLNKRLEKSSVSWGPVWFAAGTAIGVGMSLSIFFLAVQTVKAESLQ